MASLLKLDEVILPRKGKNYKARECLLFCERFVNRPYDVFPKLRIKGKSPQAILWGLKIYSAGGWIRFSICAKADFIFS